MTITLVFDLLAREAVERSIELARPFEEAEVLQPIWDAGYEFTTEMTMFHLALYREAKGGRPRLWMADYYTRAEQALCVGTPASQMYYHFDCVPVGVLYKVVFTDNLSKEIMCENCHRSIHIDKRSLDDITLDDIKRRMSFALT